MTVIEMIQQLAFMPPDAEVRLLTVRADFHKDIIDGEGTAESGVLEVRPGPSAVVYISENAELRYVAEPIYQL